MKKTVETKVNAKRLAAYSVAGVAALTSGTNTAEAQITFVDNVEFLLDSTKAIRLLVTLL